MPETTTVQINKSERNKLRILAEKNFRSMKAHLEWLINREWEHDRYRITDEGREALESERQLERVG